MLSWKKGNIRPEILRHRPKGTGRISSAIRGIIAKGTFSQSTSTALSAPIAPATENHNTQEPVSSNTQPSPTQPQNLFAFSNALIPHLRRSTNNSDNDSDIEEIGRGNGGSHNNSDVTHIKDVRVDFRGLPGEILNRIYGHIDTADLPSTMATCRQFYTQLKHRTPDLRSFTFDFQQDGFKFLDRAGIQGKQREQAVNYLSGHKKTLQQLAYYNHDETTAYNPYQHSEGAFFNKFVIPVQQETEHKFTDPQERQRLKQVVQSGNIKELEKEIGHMFVFEFMNSWRKEGEEPTTFNPNHVPDPQRTQAAREFQDTLVGMMHRGQDVRSFTGYRGASGYEAILKRSLNEDDDFRRHRYVPETPWATGILLGVDKQKLEQSGSQEDRAAYETHKRNALLSGKKSMIETLKETLEADEYRILVNSQKSTPEFQDMVRNLFDKNKRASINKIFEGVGGQFSTAQHYMEDLFRNDYVRQSKLRETSNM